MVMRFLNLDLDFFLNKNAYCRGCAGGRLGPGYKPWSVSKVQYFLEDRCGLSPDAPVQGRTVESHDGVLDFWRTLIDSSKLKIPFDVIHIDAHPDLWVGDGLYLTSEFLHVNSGRGLSILKRKHVHSGNYLTFAIVYGWIGSLVWVHLRKRFKDLSKWDDDARSGLTQLKKRECKSSSVRDLCALGRERGVPFKILPWHKFRTSEPFDYIALSKSPDFTPPESDRLITVVEGYMKQI
ncbi:MAG: UPF0489 family protein [Dehalococcoidia bacterium]